MKIVTREDSSVIHAIKSNPPRRVEGAARIDAMRRYIDNTGNGLSTIKIRYAMSLQELSALWDMAAFDRFGAISLAFRYGQAKGYRAAKARKAVNRVT